MHKPMNSFMQEGTDNLVQYMHVKVPCLLTCCMYVVPGIPYFVEVRVQESIRGLGLPIRSDVFFSQVTGEVLYFSHIIDVVTLFMTECDFVSLT